MNPFAKLFVPAVLSAACSTVAPAVHAQSLPVGPSASPASSVPAGDAALYDALGGQPALVTLVDDVTRRLTTDPRSARLFEDVDLVKFKTQLVAQLCAVSGGPCIYRGKDMKTAHAGIDVTKAHFNALVEMMQDAMDAQGIAFRVQNQLLARLAPMHRAVVNAVPG